MAALRSRLVWGCLGLARLPSLRSPVVDAATEARFAVAANELLAGKAIDVPEPRLDFLRWLAQNRAVVFHGSPHQDLLELSTERLVPRLRRPGAISQAVYASTDPVWAIYFACLRRDCALDGTKNGSMGRADGSLYPRRYFFLHNRGSASPGPVRTRLAVCPAASELRRGQAARGRDQHGAPRLPRTRQAARPPRRHARGLPVPRPSRLLPRRRAELDLAPSRLSRERAGGGNRTRVASLEG